MRLHGFCGFSFPMQPCSVPIGVICFESFMLFASPLRQVQVLINAFEESKACTLPSFAHVVARQQWPGFVYSLTVSDMHASDSSVDNTKSLDG